MKQRENWPSPSPAGDVVTFTERGSSRKVEAEHSRRWGPVHLPHHCVPTTRHAAPQCGHTVSVSEGEVKLETQERFRRKKGDGECVRPKVGIKREDRFILRKEGRIKERGVFLF